MYGPPGSQGTSRLRPTCHAALFKLDADNEAKECNELGFRALQLID